MSFNLQKIIKNYSGPKTFRIINFGCRVNAAESNLLAQKLIDLSFQPSDNNPGIIVVNTCAITAKGEYESLAKIRTLHQKYPQSTILATGCANLSKIKDIPKLFAFTNPAKESILEGLSCAYTTDIKDKFTKSHKYILKVQSGCDLFCSYCIVPHRRRYLWSLPIDLAVSTVNKAIDQGYTEVIITGVNLERYQPGLSNLLEALLTQTKIKLISFGSLPLNCIDGNFIKMYTTFDLRLSTFLHIPIQSGSDKILKLMNRPYDKAKIIKVIKKLKLKIKNLTLGTDIIVSFPTETDLDFQETYDLCKETDFKKIHTFRFSPRPGTKAELIYNQNPKISQKTTKTRSRLIRSLVNP